jgi:hypothetical protein
VEFKTSGTPFRLLMGRSWIARAWRTVMEPAHMRTWSAIRTRLPASTRSSSPNIIGPLLYNPAADIVTQGLTFEDSGRNSLNLPHRTNFDMSVYKVFRRTERIGIQFRADAFSVFNHKHFSPVDNYAGTDSFMYAGSAHSGRVLQLGLKLVF